MRAAVGRAHPFVSCVNCADGWIHVDHGARDGWRSQSAYRCQCWYVHQRKVAQLIAEALAGSTAVYVPLRKAVRAR